MCGEWGVAYIPTLSGEEVEACYLVTTDISILEEILREEEGAKLRHLAIHVVNVHGLSFVRAWL